ncbi:MAG TPA: hypothetical protein VN203_16180, partial [Candidatus Acidoferrum sp.]|nr:hypothetical protein [Candidatus Acidoferrum sp.]
MADNRTGQGGTAAARLTLVTEASSEAGGHPPGVATNGSNTQVPDKKPPSRLRRILGGLVSLAIILFIFIGVIPQFANYSQAWTAIQNMAP